MRIRSEIVKCLRLVRPKETHEPKYISGLQDRYDGRYFMYEDTPRVVMKILTFIASLAFRKMSNRGAYYKNLYGGGRR